jgi:hypothetical protein
MKYQHDDVESITTMNHAISMRIFLFWSEWDLEVFGFTSDLEGRNLPSELAPWSKNGDGEALYTGPDNSPETNTIVLAVQRYGLYLARTRAAGAPPLSRSVH